MSCLQDFSDLHSIVACEAPSQETIQSLHKKVVVHDSQMLTEQTNRDHNTIYMYIYIGERLGRPVPQPIDLGRAPEVQHHSVYPQLGVPRASNAEEVRKPATVLMPGYATNWFFMASFPNCILS